MGRHIPRAMILHTPPPGAVGITTHKIQFLVNMSVTAPRAVRVFSRITHVQTKTMFTNILWSASNVHYVSSRAKYVNNKMI